MKGVNIFLADGFEEIEALATCDILRRGGVDVKLVQAGEQAFAKGSHGITTAVDMKLGEPGKGTSAGDFMIFPGGMPGSRNLAENGKLMELAREHYSNGGSLAAICAAPGVVLPEILDSFSGVEFTCYDGFEARPISLGGTYRPDPAVVSGRVITGRGPGSAHEFAFAVLKAIKGEEVAESVRNAML